MPSADTRCRNILRVLICCRIGYIQLPGVHGELVCDQRRGELVCCGCGAFWATAIFELGVGKGCALLGELRIPLFVRFWYLDMYGDK